MRDKSALEIIRNEIDGIDSEILKLLIHRFEVVQRIRKAKSLASRSGNAGVMRPGREIEILRRLFEARRDPLPKSVVLQVWRAIISGATQLQEEIAVHCCPDSGGPAFRDVIVRHFPFGTFFHHDTNEEALVHCTSHNHVSVISAADPAALTLLMQPRFHPLAVIAKIPFLAGPEADAGFVIGWPVDDPTGHDTSLAVVSCASEAPDWPTGCQAIALGGNHKWLASMPGWLGEDEFVAALAGKGKCGLAVRLLGRYPTPIN